MAGIKGLQMALIGAIMGTGVAVHANSGQLAAQYRGYDMPPYAVESSQGDTEIRIYEPHVVAEVMVEGTRSEAISRGFRVLAGFIFGDNDGKEKVAMTVPVTQAPVSQDRWTVQFMMPPQYTLDSLPRPASQAIRFRVTDRERHAVIRFSGRSTPAALADRTAALQAYMARTGLRAAGAPRYHFYDDPFTLPWKRRNEVSIPLG